MMCVSCNPFISKVLRMPGRVRTCVLRKQRERGIFMQNTRTQIHFRDSLFVGKISINPCCSAGKETKKLLASVDTSASREWLLVEQKRFELSTYTMRTYRSSQLSYCPVLFGMSLI